MDRRCRAGGARRDQSRLVTGGNYGWRIYEGFLCTGLGPSLCNPSDYIDPLFDYSHTRGRCSVTGGYVYRGSRGTLPTGVYVYGDFCSGTVGRIETMPASCADLVLPGAGTLGDCALTLP